MTGIGHSLTGMSIAAIAMPRRWRTPALLAGMAACAVLANVPDIDLPFWGHAKYHISHSIFVNVPLIAAVLALPAAWPAMRRKLGGWPVLAAAAGAWMSHLLLDSFYSGGHGIRIFWPLSRDLALKLTMPWFDALSGGWRLDLVTFRIAATEVLFYGTPLAICLLCRRLWSAVPIPMYIGTALHSPAARSSDDQQGHVGDDIEDYDDDLEQPDE